MFHFFEAITNTKGDALPGYFGQVTDGSGNIVPIYADDSSTPIISVSGVANMAKVDSNGNLSFYVASGIYTLTIFSTDGVTQALSPIPNVPMGTSTITAASGASVSTRAALAAIVGPVANQSAILTESGREGTFVFSTANLSAKVTADTAQGIYVAPSSDTTGATGAWVRKFKGPVEVDWFGPDGVNDTPAIHAACALAATIGLNHVRNSSTRTCTTGVVIDEANMKFEGVGAAINCSFDGLAFAFSGSGCEIFGHTLNQSATGADPAPYVEQSGANSNVHDNVFTRSAGAHIPYYVRSGAAGGRFRNNRCTWYGGLNLISNLKDFEISGNSLINSDATASDDGIAIKAIAGVAENILITDNYFENMADFVGIGSEIGSLAAADPTYSNIARGITITGNRGKNCGCIVFIKPGAVDGVDYRDGTVRGVTISDNTLIDASGTNMMHGIRIAAGRGARVIDVTGKNNRVIGRTKTGAANVAGEYIYIRNDTLTPGTTDCLVEKIDVGIEVIDPYDGAAAGGTAPGSPWPLFVNLEKQSTANGTVRGINLDVIGNGSGTSGIRVQAGFDNAVTVRRALLTNVDTNLSSSFGGIHTDSAIAVGSEINMTIAAGSSGVQYKLGGTGSITPLFPQQLAAFSMVGNTSSSVANAAAVTGIGRVIAQSAAAVSLTGSTTETTMATINLPAGIMGNNGRIELEADFSYPSSANVKTVKVKLGSSVTWTTTPTTTTHVVGNVAIANRGVANSQRWSAQHRLSSNTFADTAGTTAIDTSGITTLTITGQLALGTETLTLEAYRVLLYSAA